MTDQPAMSVIVVAYESESTVAATLEGLRAQRLRDFETILVDSSPTDATAALVSERFPEVRLVRSSRRLLPHAARNHGAGHARGQWLAFTDADCVPTPGWLEALATAHAAGHEIAGGPLACLDRDPRAWVAHLAKFSQWLPGQPAGPRRDLPSANLSVSRDLFERIGPFPEDRWAGDTVLSWRAVDAGALPVFVPAAVVGHRHATTLSGLLVERYRRGHDYGQMRAAVQGWSARRLALYLVATPLVAVALTARVVRQAPGRLRAVALASLPAQFAVAAAWALGEARAHAALLSRAAR